MQIEQTDLSGVMILTPRRHGDDRGFFAETVNRAVTACVADRDSPVFREEFQWVGADSGCDSGLRFQAPPRSRGQLIRCGSGAAHVVVVEARRGAPDYGKAIAATISAEDGRQIWVPVGRLTGWVTRQPGTVILSNATDYLVPELAGTLSWKGLVIDWALPDGLTPPFAGGTGQGPAFADWSSPFTLEAAA